MKIIKAKNYSGLTLVELQVVIAIFGGIALLLASVYYIQTRLYNEEKINIQISNENRISLDEVTIQAREARSVVTGCSVCGADTNSSSTVLILQAWPLDASGDPTDPLGTNHDYIVYKKDGTKFVKNVFPHATSTRLALDNKILSTTTKTVLFEYNDADPAQATEVEITLTNEAKSFLRTHSITQSSKAKLRNK